MHLPICDQLVQSGAGIVQAVHEQAPVIMFAVYATTSLSTLTHVRDGLFRSLVRSLLDVLDLFLGGGDALLGEVGFK